MTPVRTGPWIRLAAEVSPKLRDPGAYRALSYFKRSIALYQSDVADRHTFDVGDGVIGPAGEQPGVQPQVRGPRAPTPGLSVLHSLSFESIPLLDSAGHRRAIGRIDHVGK